MGILGFNWLPQPSAWQQMENWRTQSKAASQQFLDNMSALSDTVTGVQSDQSSGMANLAAQAALNRINAEAKTAQAKRAAAAFAPASTYPSLGRKIVSSDDTAITFSDGTSIPLKSTTTSTLAGGSKLDLQGGTLTLRDGTQINLKTGLKKVNITV